MNLSKKLNYWICNVSLAAAAAVALIMFFSHNVIEWTLSQLGREEPVLFFLWGVFTSFALFLNLRFLCRKLGVNFKFLDIIMSISCFILLITVTVPSGEDRPVLATAVHWTTSITFGIVTFLCYVFILVYAWKVKGEKRLKIYVYALLFFAALDISFLCFLGLTALCEMFILICCKIILYILNFLVKPEKEKITAGEKAGEAFAGSIIVETAFEETAFGETAAETMNGEGKV